MAQNEIMAPLSWAKNQLGGFIMKIREENLKRALEVALSWNDLQARCLIRFGIRLNKFR